jgi:Putative zincin peptidase
MLVSNRSQSAASQSRQQALDVVEWRPGRSSAVTWTVLGAGVMALGLGLFAFPSILRAGSAGGTFQIGLVDIVLVVALTVLLVIGHEAIHGLAMLCFGARPSFGTILVGGVVPAVYATAEGYRFTRSRFLAVAAAPAVVISVLGLMACLGPWAGYLIVPLAIHLGGCVGDGFAGWRVLREPPGAVCEDLRDGIRFYRPAR